MIICGIDPGLSGGLSFFNNETLTVHAEKAPIFQLKTKTKNKRFLDMWTLMSMLDEHNPDHVYIEKQQAMPQQGLVSTFATGMGYGIYLGLLVAGGWSYTEVASRTWKKDLNCTADKDFARKRASELMPNGSHLWQQKNQDGIAEASLIAYWGIYKSN
tara:strand:+ start:1408 stop:1881 length:474 start_codon:yes stop_codon:yes gene_type:complete